MTQRAVAFLVFPDFQLLDLTGPLSAFHAAAQYRTSVVSAEPGRIRASAGLEVIAAPVEAGGLDTLVVVGGPGARRLAPTGRLNPLVQRLSAGARRTASVCTGAFLLAAAGLLDGRRATTHWRAAPEFQRAYPAVRLESDRIFVRDGAVWTSAGITAGIDLALALIEEDLGTAASRAVARELVVYHRRPGGQSQFSALLDLPSGSDRIGRVLSYARENLDGDLGLGRLADVACLSARQFGRAFRAETGETPARAVERLRVDAARARIETGREPIEAIAAAVGFADPERMRRAFLRRLGHPPQALRRLARGGVNAAAAPSVAPGCAAASSGPPRSRAPNGSARPARGPRSPGTSAAPDSQAPGRGPAI